MENVMQMQEDGRLKSMLHGGEKVEKYLKNAVREYAVASFVDARRMNRAVPACLRTVVLRLGIDAVSLDEAAAICINWAESRRARSVCVANVHMTMEAWDHSELCEVFNGADLVVADGMPVVWALRLLGVRNASRVRGPDLMLRLCDMAAERNIPIGLYGGNDETLEKVVSFLKTRAPSLEVVAKIAPPFRPLTEEENTQYVTALKASGARLIFVGIGCPKQETWMAKNRSDIDAVTLGVGAAFDIFSGKTRSAPIWMQRAGLEWLFRLCSEPQRLWWRYFKHNPRFVVYLLRQWLTHKGKSPGSAGEAVGV